MTNAPHTLTERRQIEREIERLRECATCSEAAGGCDRIEIEIAELESRMRELINNPGGDK